MLKAFPAAPLYTAFYEPSATFPEFDQADMRLLQLNRMAPLRKSHRFAMPLLAPMFGRLQVQADVVVCSSSGWAHGAGTAGQKIVYCHSPARWLYQQERYLGEGRSLQRGVLMLLRPYLLGWDRRAAASAHRYLTNSSAVRDRIQTTYGIDAEVVPPPPTIAPDGPSRSVDGLAPGFVLCVSRLLPYKNVDAVVEAFAGLPEARLVIVGDGPDEPRLRAKARSNVTFAGGLEDDELRWLYGNCSGLVAASYEDYGLTPLEAAMFGKPTAALRWGGFLDTVVEKQTGLFFDSLDPRVIREAVRKLAEHSWDSTALQRRAERYSERRFVARLREIVFEEGNRRIQRQRVTRA